MKKFLIVLSLVIATSVIADPPYVNNVTSNSTKIVAQQGISGAFQWVGTNTYAQGAIVKNNSQFYMAVIGGTSTNLAPIHNLGSVDVARDGVTWRVFQHRRRNGVAVVNTGTNDVSISLGYPAIGGSGIVLNSNGGSFSLDNDSYQGAIYAALAVDNTNTVSSITW